MPASIIPGDCVFERGKMVGGSELQQTNRKGRKQILLQSLYHSLPLSSGVIKKTTVSPIY